MRRIAPSRQRGSMSFQISGQTVTMKPTTKGDKAWVNRLKALLNKGEAVYFDLGAPRAVKYKRRAKDGLR